MLGYYVWKFQVCGDLSHTHTHTRRNVCPAKLRRTTEGREKKLEILIQTISNNGRFCAAGCASESFIKQ